MPHQIRHVAVASHSPLLKTVVTLSREPRDLLFGELCQQGPRWLEIFLKKQDGSRWEIGAIDQISISPDGTTIFAIEETGRFAVIRIQESNCVVAHSYQLPYYLKMDISFESKKKQDLYRSFQFPGSIRILTNPSHYDIAMRGIEIESCTWLDQNRFIAIAYDDGRIVKFDTHKMRVDRTLRTSQWKWSQRTGTIERYHTDKEKPIPSANIFLAEDEKTEFVRTIGVFGDEYFVFQNYSRVCSIMNLKSGKIINQPLQVGFAIPISQYQFAIISRNKHKSHGQWIDVRYPAASVTYDTEGLFDQEKYFGYPLFGDGYISNGGIIQLLVSGSSSSGFRYSSATIHTTSQKKLPMLSKHDILKLSEENVKGAVFGPSGKTIRYCQYPHIVELNLLD